MEFTIKIKYNVGDKVWIMNNGYPSRMVIKKIRVQGAEIDEHGANNNFGHVTYYLDGVDNYEGYREDQLCDTFDQLRDYVFPDSLRDQ